MRWHLSGRNRAPDRAGVSKAIHQKQLRGDYAKATTKILYERKTIPQLYTERGDGAIMWQVKNTSNIIDYRIVASYYYLISCECGYESVVIKRRYADKRIARVIRDHACETEKGQGQ